MKGVYAILSHRPNLVRGMRVWRKEQSLALTVNNASIGVAHDTYYEAAHFHYDQ